MTAAPPPATRRAWRPGLTWVAVISTLEVVSVVFGLGPPVQPTLSIIFASTCPGFLLLDLRRPADMAARVMLGIAASLSLNVLIVTVALIGDRSWVVPGIVALLIGLAALPRHQLRALLNRLGLGGKSENPDATIVAGGSTRDGADAALPPMNLNLASVTDLQLIPGMGSRLAAAIIALRDVHGPFDSIDQLLDVPGLGPAKLAVIQPFLSVDGVRPADPVEEEQKMDHHPQEKETP